MENVRIKICFILLWGISGDVVTDTIEKHEKLRFIHTSTHAGDDAVELFVGFEGQVYTHVLYDYLEHAGAASILFTTFGNNDWLNGAANALVRLHGLGDGWTHIRRGTIDAKIQQRVDAKLREAAANDKEFDAKTAACIQESLKDLSGDVHALHENMAALCGDNITSRREMESTIAKMQEALEAAQALIKNAQAALEAEQATTVGLRQALEAEQATTVGVRQALEAEQATTVDLRRALEAEQATSAGLRQALHTEQAMSTGLRDTLKLGQDADRNLRILYNEECDRSDRQRRMLNTLNKDIVTQRGQLIAAQNENAGLRVRIQTLDDAAVTHEKLDALARSLQALSDADKGRHEETKTIIKHIEKNSVDTLCAIVDMEEEAGAKGRDTGLLNWVPPPVKTTMLCSAHSGATMVSPSCMMNREAGSTCHHRRRRCVQWP